MIKRWGFKQEEVYVLSVQHKQLDSYAKYIHILKI